MKDLFKELFEYNHHFNQALAVAFMRESEKLSHQAHSLYSHTLNAHQIWNNRILPMQPLPGVWDLQTVNHRGEIDADNYRHSLKILAEISLAATINYSNSQGQPFSNSVRDILFHIVNHSTYHRGQIATEFRNSGIEPIHTDYILYKR